MSIPPSTLCVAIVGSGPAGFYAAETLQKAAPGVRIDMFDRLPTPFGLVRGGVAPDHPKIKSVSRVFERIAADPGFRFLGNVAVGQDVTHEAMRRHYDAIIYAVGAEADRHLGIPGEQLSGSHSATELVGWYNGHPDFADRTFDLSHRAAAVIGIGNVAMDVTRVLATSTDVLATTDLAANALAALQRAQVDTIHILARRGPVQAACTTPELKELGAIDGVDVVVDPRDLELDPVSAAHLRDDHDRTAENNLALLRRWAERGHASAPRKIVLHFCVSPVALLGATQIDAIRLMKNILVPDGHGDLRAEATGRTVDLPVGLVFRSVGYRGIEIPGLPFDPQQGIVPNISGRVVESVGSATFVRGVYVCGWIKRGPHGVIGTNKVCAAETIDHVLADAVAGRIAPAPGSPDKFAEELAEAEIDVVTWDDWVALDRIERERGAPAGRPREKIVAIPEMMDAIRAARQSR